MIDLIRKELTFMLFFCLLFDFSAVLKIESFLENHAMTKVWFLCNSSSVDDQLLVSVEYILLFPKSLHERSSHVSGDYKFRNGDAGSLVSMWP